MMNARTIALALCLLAVGGSTFAAAEDGFVSMFNGKDLTGWAGIPGVWSVEGGAITAESTKEKPCEKTHYLYYTISLLFVATVRYWPADGTPNRSKNR